MILPSVSNFRRSSQEDLVADALDFTIEGVNCPGDEVDYPAGRSVVHPAEVDDDRLLVEQVLGYFLSVRIYPRFVKDDLAWPAASLAGLNGHDIAVTAVSWLVAVLHFFLFVVMFLVGVSFLIGIVVAEAEKVLKFVDSFTLPPLPVPAVLEERNIVVIIVVVIGVDVNLGNGAAWVSIRSHFLFFSLPLLFFRVLPS